MFISFVLIQVKRTKEKIKTPTGQFHFTLYIPVIVGTGVYLLSDSPGANDIMELRSIGQV
ncbi:MAG: hypothetical protein J7K51_07160 [Thermotogae bacterium]|nr:hypothetical protein [Thermotogota bacterium]